MSIIRKSSRNDEIELIQYLIEQLELDNSIKSVIMIDILKYVNCHKRTKNLDIYLSLITKLFEQNMSYLNNYIIKENDNFSIIFLCKIFET